jgi:hypothetical protein
MELNRRPPCRFRRLYVALSLSLLCLGCGSSHAPADNQLIANFKQHRSEIATLMDMMRADKVIRRVDDTWTDPADPSKAGVSPARIAEYRRILKDVGYPRGFYFNPESGSVVLVAWAIGLGVSGASKSFMYDPPNLVPLVEDLDAYHPQPGQGQVLAFRRVDDHWYLEYDAN